MTTQIRFLDYLSGALEGANGLSSGNFLDTFEAVCDVLSTAIENGNRIFVAGNGGSHADSLHIAGELVNYFTKPHKALPVMALGANGSVLTAWANDHSYIDQYMREMSAFSSEGDAFIGITTSGASENILKCFEFARQNGMVSICLTGKSDAVKNLVNVDYILSVESSFTPHIQESHVIIYHALCKELEYRLN